MPIIPKLRRVAPWFVAASIFHLALARADAAAELGFISPKSGARVTNPVTVRFATDGAQPEHAHDGSHVHLLLDAPAPAAGEAMAMDAHHLHFMHGEPQAVLEIPPGDHTLQLVRAGADHRVGSPPVLSERITIHVLRSREPAGLATKTNKPALAHAQRALESPPPEK